MWVCKNEIFFTLCWRGNDGYVDVMGRKELGKIYRLKKDLIWDW